MAKVFVFPDNTRIPADDVSDQSTVICYPQDMDEVNSIWTKLSPEATNHQIMVNPDGTEFELWNPEDLHFNKIELEHCSTGLLMRMVFASSLEREYRKVLAEKAELETAYNIAIHGREEV